MKARLGEHLDFSNGSGSPVRTSEGDIPVYGANGPIGYATQPNARGPLIVIGRVGSYCGSVHYCDSDVWVTDNAFVCRAKNPRETRYWYYALQTCGLNDHRAGSGQPLLNRAILRDVPVRTAAAAERERIAGLLGALDDKIAANRRVIEAAESLMVATAEPIDDYVPLSTLASRSTVSLNAGEFDDVIAHFSLPAFDDHARPQLVAAGSVRSAKFVLPGPCVLVAKLNPRIPRIWNVVSLPSEMALASTEDTVAQQVAGTSGSHQRIQPRDLLDVRVRDVRRLSDGAVKTISGLGVLCHTRRTESARLAALRDAVLPRLISGELAVRPPR